MYYCFVQPAVQKNKLSNHSKQLDFPTSPIMSGAPEKNDLNKVHKPRLTTDHPKKREIYPRALNRETHNCGGDFF